MKAIGRWRGGYATTLDDGRGNSVVVDLPVEEDGQDGGTSALELSVLALAGCITTIFALVAERRKVPFDGLEVELEAQRPRGARTITSVEGVARISSAAREGDVATALEVTLRTCPVGVLFAQAGIPVRVHPEVSLPGIASSTIAT